MSAISQARAAKLLEEIVEDWPVEYSVEISGDAFKRFTVTLWRRDAPHHEREEISHCHLDSLEEGLKQALIWKQEDETK